jgi:hypothetical protein
MMRTHSASATGTAMPATFARVAFLALAAAAADFDAFHAS